MRRDAVANFIDAMGVEEGAKLLIGNSFELVKITLDSDYYVVYLDDLVMAREPKLSDAIDGALRVLRRSRHSYELNAERWPDEKAS